MLWFKSAEEKELDKIVQRMEMNLSNNYKDNAQDNLREFEERLEALQKGKRLKEQVYKKYEAVLAIYQAKLDGYSHKDQKPFWH